MYVSMSLAREVSLASAATWSSERLRSRSTACAASWLLQKSGSATRASRAFRRSRCCGASKIAPYERDALLESFVAMLKIFENHFAEPIQRKVFPLRPWLPTQQQQNNRNNHA